MHILGNGSAANTFLAICQRSRQACIVDFSDSDVGRWGRIVDSLGVHVDLVLQTHFDKHSTLGLKHLHDANAFAHARVVGFGTKPAIEPSKPAPSAQQALDVIRMGEDRFYEEKSGSEHAHEIDHYVADGDVISVGDLRFHVVHTPGVSDDHVLYYEPNEGIVFSGDLIRPGSSPLVQDAEAQVESLKRFVRVIPETTIILPNHTGLTTVGHERRSNPVLVDIPGPPLLVGRKAEKVIEHSKALKEEQPFPQTGLQKSRRFFYWL